MKYNAPIGAADPNDPYIDGNPGTGTEGSPVPAAAIEHPMREIMEVITQAGLVPDEGNLAQLYAAIQLLIAANVVGAATTAIAGIVELATEQEIRDGSADKILEAAAFLSAIGVSSHYSSGNQSWANGGLISLAHAMGRTPKLISYSFECLTAQHGYAIGDVVDLSGSNSGTNSLLQWGITARSPDVNNTNLRVGSTGITIAHATSGTRSTLTPAYWGLRADLWA